MRSSSSNSHSHSSSFHQKRRTLTKLSSAGHGYHGGGGGGTGHNGSASHGALGSGVGVGVGGFKGLGGASAVGRNVPKLVNTSSLRKENGGQDITAVLVNRHGGKKIGWGSSVTPSSSSPSPSPSSIPPSSSNTATATANISDDAAANATAPNNNSTSNDTTGTANHQANHNENSSSNRASNHATEQLSDHHINNNNNNSHSHSMLSGPTPEEAETILAKSNQKHNPETTSVGSSGSYHSGQHRASNRHNEQLGHSHNYNHTYSNDNDTPWNHNRNDHHYQHHEYGNNRYHNYSRGDDRYGYGHGHGHGHSNSQQPYSHRVSPSASKATLPPSSDEFPPHPNDATTAAIDTATDTAVDTATNTAVDTATDMDTIATNLNGTSANKTNHNRQYRTSLPYNDGGSGSGRYNRDRDYHHHPSSSSSSMMDRDRDWSPRNDNIGHQQQQQPPSSSSSSQQNYPYSRGSGRYNQYNSHYNDRNFDNDRYHTTTNMNANVNDQGSGRRTNYFENEQRFDQKRYHDDHNRDRQYYRRDKDYNYNHNYNNSNRYPSSVNHNHPSSPPRNYQYANERYSNANTRSYNSNNSHSSSNNNNSSSRNNYPSSYDSHPFDRHLENTNHRSSTSTSTSSQYRSSNGPLYGKRDYDSHSSSYSRGSSHHGMGAGAPPSTSTSIRENDEVVHEKLDAHSSHNSNHNHSHDESKEEQYVEVKGIKPKHILKHDDNNHENASDPVDGNDNRGTDGIADDGVCSGNDKNQNRARKVNGDEEKSNNHHEKKEQDAITKVVNEKDKEDQMLSNSCENTDFNMSKNPIPTNNARVSDTKNTYANKVTKETKWYDDDDDDDDDDGGGEGSGGMSSNNDVERKKQQKEKQTSARTNGKVDMTNIMTSQDIYETSMDDAREKEVADRSMEELEAEEEEGVAEGMSICTSKNVTSRNKNISQLSANERFFSAVSQTTTQPTQNQYHTNTRKDEDDNKDERMKTKKNIQVGNIVYIQDRMWPGVNKPGGIGRITKINSNSEAGLKYDVTYVLGGKEKMVDGAFVSLKKEENVIIENEEETLSINNSIELSDLPAVDKSEISSPSPTRKSRRVGERKKVELWIKKIDEEMKNKMKEAKQQKSDSKEIITPSPKTTEKTKSRKRKAEVEVDGQSEKKRNGQKKVGRDTLTCDAFDIEPKDAFTLEEMKYLAQKRYQSLVFGDIKKKKAQVVGITTSSLSEEEQATVKLLCKTVNAKLLNDFHPKKTKICITSASEENTGVSKMRTVKAMRSALAGVPILNSQWVSSCLENKCIMPIEEKFCIRTLPTKVEHFMNNFKHQQLDNNARMNITTAHYGVLQLSAHHESAVVRKESLYYLFKNVSVYLCGNGWKKSAAKAKDVNLILRESGATILNSLANVTKLLKKDIGMQDSPRILVLLCDGTINSVSTGFTSNIAELIKETKRNAKKDNRKCPVLIVNSNWIFDSISCCTILGTDHYEPSGSLVRSLWQDLR